MKKCPFCAEEIQDEAIKCRYCGEEIKKKIEEKKNSPRKKIYTLIFWGIVIIIAYFIFYDKLSKKPTLFTSNKYYLCTEPPCKYNEYGAAFDFGEPYALEKDEDLEFPKGWRLTSKSTYDIANNKVVILGGAYTSSRKKTNQDDNENPTLDINPNSNLGEKLNTLRYLFKIGEINKKQLKELKNKIILDSLTTSQVENNTSIEKIENKELENIDKEELEIQKERNRILEKKLKELEKQTGIQNKDRIWSDLCIILFGLPACID